MKNIKRIISILTVVCCFVFSCSFAVSAAEETPRVTFINREKDSPDLYIKKIVKNVSDDYPAPKDDTFFFVISIDDEVVSNLQYRVYDASGQEVKNTNSDDVNLGFFTDRYGKFTLKAGQTAVFEQVGSGTAYVVTEISAGADYIQIHPVGGSAAVGTVGPKGTVVEFENLYNPYVEKDPTVEFTTLVVQNNISFPNGYKPWQVDDFTFTAKIGGKPLADESYIVTNTADDSMVEKRKTDENGNFTLAGGQTATFSEVVLGADYEVEEIKIPEGWRVIGKSLYGGATKLPLTFVSFNNASASFIVSKSMDDATHPQKDFTFILTKADDDAWIAAQYYLYDMSSDKLIDDEIHITKEDGSFQLKPGQAAIFIGIDVGTIYNVKEMTDDEYHQVVPTDSKGYIRKEVLDTVVEWPFINQALMTRRVLRVTKKAESMTTQDPPGTDLFTFQILQENALDEYEPVADADYSILVGSSQHNYRSDEDGMFYLRVNETASFTALLPGNYQIKEIEWNEHYEPKDDVAQNGTLTNDGVSFTFTNLYWQVPPTGIRGLSPVWKILIGVVAVILLAFVTVVLIKRRKRMVWKKKL